jgi:hypothetical protein
MTHASNHLSPGCVDCAGPIGERNKTGRCRTCSSRALGISRRLPPNACLDCGTNITRDAKRCQPCANALVNSSPDVKAARAAGIRRTFKDPAHRQKMRAVIIRNATKARADPAYHARLVEHGKKQYAVYLNTPEARANNLAARRANSHKITEHWLGWCPLEHRAEYARLRLSKRMLAADARKIIEAAIRAEKARPKTFEEQLQAVLDGKATIYTVSKASNDPEFTLGGVSSGWAA